MDDQRHGSGQLPEDEQVRVKLRDPEIQARVEEIKARIARGELGTPLRGEDLREFLREYQVEGLDAR